MKHLNIYYKIFSLLGIAIISFQGNAQQDPQFTQYMYNMSVINPAYATAEEGIINLGGLYRAQWVGIDGAPTTGTFFAHSPINERIEAGISFVNDQIGDVANTNQIFADFAYVLPIGKTSKLSFGLKGGVSLFNANLTALNTSVLGDDAFQNINRAFPNVGIGAYYFSDKYYVGLSAPNMLSTKYLEEKNGIKTTGVENVHYFLTGGYVFDLNSDFKLKPAFMARSVVGAPLALDLTANVLMYEKLEAGLGYRLGDSFSGLVNFRVTSQLRIGYAYDYITSNLGQYGSGSHEIFVLFDLDSLGFKKGYDRSPRFF